MRAHIICMHRPKTSTQFAYHVIKETVPCKSKQSVAEAEWSTERQSEYGNSDKAVYLLTRAQDSRVADGGIFFGV